MAEAEDEVLAPPSARMKCEFLIAKVQTAKVKFRRLDFKKWRGDGFAEFMRDEEAGSADCQDEVFQSGASDRRARAAPCLAGVRPVNASTAHALGDQPPLEALPRPVQLLAAVGKG